jgi:uncharacterized protein YPO0396
MSELTESLRHMADDSMGMEPGDRQVLSEAAGRIKELEDWASVEVVNWKRQITERDKRIAKLEAQLKAAQEAGE